MSKLRRINSMPAPVSKQVASVRRTELIELRNRQKELRKQVEAQATENTTLKFERAKFDTALAKYTGENSEFAVMRENQRKETQQLSNELHSNNRKCQKFDRKIRATEDELNEKKELLRRYRDLIDKERLEGAETLAERLRQNEEGIREKDVEIQNLRTEIESLTLSQQEEIKSEKRCNRQAKKHVQDLKKELETIETRLKEKSKEIDLQNMYSCTRKSSTSVGTLPSKSEKPHPRTFASHRNSDSPLLSSRQKAKLYAVNRQAQLRRIREERQKHQQMTEKENGFDDAKPRQHQLEEENALFQARLRKQPSEDEEEEFCRALQLERWESTEKEEEETMQRMERQQQLEEKMRKSMCVESKDLESHLKELLDVGTDKDEEDDDREDEQWMKSKDAYRTSMDEEIDQRVLKLNNRRINKRRRSVEKMHVLEEEVKTRPLEERRRMEEERKRSWEEDIEGKRVEERERLEDEHHMFEEDKSRTQLEKRKIREECLQEETTEDSEKQDSRQTQLSHPPIKALSADLQTPVDVAQSANVATEKKWVTRRKEYNFTRSTVHLHRGHPTHKIKFVPWARGHRDRNENSLKDNP